MKKAHCAPKRLKFKIISKLESSKTKKNNQTITCSFSLTDQVFVFLSVIMISLLLLMSYCHCITIYFVGVFVKCVCDFILSYFFVFFFSTYFFTVIFYFVFEKKISLLLLTVQPNDVMNAQNYHHECNIDNEMIFANNYTMDISLGNYSNGYHPHHFRL